MQHGTLKKPNEVDPEWELKESKFPESYPFVILESEQFQFQKDLDHLKNIIRSLLEDHSKVVQERKEESWDQFLYFKLKGSIIFKENKDLHPMNIIQRNLNDLFLQLT